jgi:Type II secretion system (T2SS), protein E, N-terminal domain
MKSRSDNHLPVETEQVYRNVDGTVAVERITRDAPVIERRRRPERRPSLAGLLVGAGFTSYEQITEALEEGLGTGERLGEVIVRRGWATEDNLAALLAEQWSLPYVDAAHIRVQANAVEELSPDRARELEALPIRRDNGRLVVALGEPSDERFAKVRDLLGDPAFVVVARSVLDRLLDDPAASFAAAVAPVAEKHETSVATGLRERLAAILDETSELETALRHAELERDAARADRRRDAERIAQLEATLELRDDLLDALRSKLAEA